MAGNNMQSAYTWTFTTGSLPQGGAILSGHVRDSGGVGVSQVNVYAYGSGFDGLWTQGSAVTAADGSYSIPLLPGTYSVNINFNPSMCMPMPPDFTSCPPPPGPSYSENVNSVSVTGATAHDLRCRPL